MRDTNCPNQSNVLLLIIKNALCSRYLLRRIKACETALNVLVHVHSLSVYLIVPVSFNRADHYHSKIGICTHRSSASCCRSSSGLGTSSAQPISFQPSSLNRQACDSGCDLSRLHCKFKLRYSLSRFSHYSIDELSFSSTYIYYESL